MNKIKNLVIAVVGLFTMFACQNQQPNIISQKDKDLVSGTNAFQMVNPEIDDPEKPWSYSPKPTLVIGIPFTPAPVQVSYDGAIYTGYAELSFFYGEKLAPVLARQRTFMNGWIPIVQNDWKENNILYATEYFGCEVEGIKNRNSIQFAKIKVKNEGSEAKTVTITSASRGSGLDHRYRQIEACVPTTKFEMTNTTLLRDDKLIYTYPENNTKLATPETEYTTIFTAKDYHITQRAEVGLSKYTVNLKPGESKEWVFKMPRVPISKENKTELLAIENANYETHKSQTIKFWKELVDNNVSFEIPEKRANESYRASLVHLILATREIDGSRRQGSGLPYDGLFLNDYVDMRLAYDVMGLTDYVDVNAPWLLKQQAEDGMLVDMSLTHRKAILASHGQALFSLAHHYIMSHDTDYIQKVYPAMKKAVEWISNEHYTNENGLLKASIPYDNEMIKGHYTSHNLWGIAGVRTAIRVAKLLNNQADVLAWEKLHKSYIASVLKAINTSKKENNYLPPGLYDYIMGEEARKGLKKFRTGQDWENNLLVFPSEVLEIDNPIVMGTLETIRKNKYREGVMTYRNGQHIHQYITYNQAQQYMAIGETKRALTDFYHILLHNGSVHEVFENLVEPWGDRDPDPSPSPHGWAAAKTVVFTRNMLVREHGGELGLQAGKRNLYLFSLLSPAWVQDGKSVKINNAPTEMGRISASIDFKKESAHITIQQKFHQHPQYIAIPTPYFKSMVSYESNAKESFDKNGVMYFSPDVTDIDIVWENKNMENENNYQSILKTYRSEPSLKWKGYDRLGNIKSIVEHMDIEKGELITIPGSNGFLLDDEIDYPATHLSFDLVVKTYRKEFKRRFKEHIESGKTPVITEPVFILSSEQRKQLFEDANNSKE